ncbi:MAG TPA: methyltransferase domain-containing protein [Vicinamibacteria bacterium]
MAGAPMPPDGAPPPEVEIGHTRITVPVPRVLTPAERLWLGVRGAALLPIALARARRLNVPGLRWHAVAMRLGLRLLARRTVRWQSLYRLMFFPLDSTRYFEFDFLGGAAEAGAAEAGAACRYLDVSSPRLLPLGLLWERPGWSATLLNPHLPDLELTKAMAEGLGFGARCRTISSSIAEAPLEPGSFDLITCMSVLEHIPRDGEALEAMWRLLRPGARLLLSVPCAARAFEQSIDRNEYGLLAPEADGFVFWQRFYDEDGLRARIFSVTGPPVRQAVYGETEPGAFARNAQAKRSDPAYPFWREAVMMGREYAVFPSVPALPGEGVAAMELVKR